MLLVALITALVGPVFSQVESEEFWAHGQPVHVLTDANFTSFVNQNPAVLVVFCTPWSVDCKNFESYLDKMRKFEYQPPLKLAKVDTSTQIETALKLKIRKHPTIQYFLGGQPHLYQGRLIDYEINKWVRKVSHPLVSWIETSEELQKASQEFLSYVLTVPDDHPELLKSFEQVAARHQHVLFYITKLEEAKSRLWTPDTFNLIAFRQFNDGRRSISSKNPFFPAEIDQFVNETLNPVVLEMTDETLDSTVRQRQDAAVCIYTSLESPLLRTFEKLAPLRIADLHYLKYNGYGENSQKIRATLEAENAPDALRIIKYSEGGDEVIHFMKQPTEANVREFLRDFSAGNLTTWSRSEEPVPDQTGPLYTIVAKEFETKVLDESKDVVILFVSDYCKHCGEVLHSLNSFIRQHTFPDSTRFYMMNLSHNDHPLVPYSEIPEIFVYPKNRKEQPVPFSNSLSEENFRQYLQSHTGMRFNRSGKLDDLEDSL